MLKTCLEIVKIKALFSNRIVESDFVPLSLYSRNEKKANISSNSNR